MQRIVHLVPNLTPTISGVGDYATLLTERLGALVPAPRENRLVACGHQRQAVITAPNVINLTGECDTGMLTRTIRNLAPNGLVINYVGYGYAPRGAPLWLLRAVENIRQRLPDIRVLVMFHELYATGHPWQSAFWLSPLQRYVARCLVELSDSWITNREDSAKWLRQYAPDIPHAVLPVFSNVGEQAIYSSMRRAKIVVFGGSVLRRATYLAAGSALFSWAKDQGLEIHDIGPPITDERLASELKKMNVCFHGQLTAADASSQLMDAELGIVAYSGNFVAKSGVFAAYCAHGVCPVLISKLHTPMDGLIADQHYLAGIPHPAGPCTHWKSVAACAWNWYRTHRVNTHAEAFKDLLEK